MENRNRVTRRKEERSIRSVPQRLEACVVLDPITAVARPAVDARPAKKSELVVASRLLLYPSEISRLPQSSRAVRVRSGVAWVTHAGRDIVGRQGETISLEQGRGFAIASPLRGTPLVIEVLARGH